MNQCSLSSWKIPKHNKFLKMALGFADSSLQQFKLHLMDKEQRIWLNIWKRWILSIQKPFYATDDLGRFHEIVERIIANNLCWRFTNEIFSGSDILEYSIKMVPTLLRLMKVCSRRISFEDTILSCRYPHKLLLN